MTKILTTLAQRPLALCLAICAAALISGCPGDESSDMAKAISGGGGRPAPGGSSGGGGSTEKAPDSENAAVQRGKRGAEEAAPEGEETEAVKTTKVEVEILSQEVKAPYPEYEDEGLYDVMVEVLAPKDPETDLSFGTRVWKIVLLGKDGTEVASMEKQLKVPDHKPGTLRFNGVYALARPETVEFHLSDKKAAVAGASETKEGEGGREGEEGGGGPGRGRGGGGSGEEEGGGAEGGGAEGGGEEEGGSAAPPVEGDE